MAKKKPKVFETPFNTYTVVKQIGQGGNATVYEVKDDQGASFALKLLKPNCSTEKAKRFKNELYFGKSHSHKNIVPILDDGFILENGEKSLFFVMPLYEKTLRQLMNDGINPDDIQDFFLQLLDGIESAHNANIFHRDLKPENIFWNSSENTLVIGDWGIAHFNVEDLLTAFETKNNFHLGSYQYSAPEQRQKGREVNNRADFFALGKILNEMFTGELYEGTNPKLISTVSPDYRYLDTLVDRVTQQNPNDRPSSSKEIKLSLKVEFNQQVRLQKRSELDGKTIPETEVDDPFIDNPIEVVGFIAPTSPDAYEYILQLNSEPSQRWINYFRREEEDYLFRCRHRLISNHQIRQSQYSFVGDQVKIITNDPRQAQYKFDDFNHRLSHIKVEYPKFIEREEKEKQAQAERELREKLYEHRKWEEGISKLKI